ncbi:golgin subfamily A member 3-like [Littorina saxatilis]|uniref:Golgin subfamily A member 3 n=1 Tax=Littorina saxatilis TaxID=31220 RepID=A0AAN9AJI9_9CAEN
MEPFELKLHQVTFDESDGNLGQGQTQPELDSFSALVHYDFQDKTGSEDVQDGVNLQDLTFQKQGKKSPDKSKTSPYHTPTLTTTTPACIQLPITSTQTVSSLVQSPAPWETTYAGDQGGQENFLVNPDDYYLSPSRISKVSPESAAASLRTLSQVSHNTAAIAKHLRKSQGGKRRVAKTFLTTTSFSTPRTMPSETSQPSTTPAPTPVSQEGDAGGGGEGVDDSSFETVAEALRLQWSVIGNSNITPASPEEVARIVAEAEKRLRGGAGPDNTEQMPPPFHALGDPNASDTLSVGSLSSLSSMSSSTNDNGLVAADTSQNVGSVTASSAESTPPAELIRIPAQSITREVGKSSWFQSKDKQGAASLGEKHLAGTRSPRRVNSGSNLAGGTSVESVKSDTSLKAQIGTDGSQQMDTKEAGAPQAPTQELLSQQESVPFGTGITSPSDLSFKYPMGSTPYTSPSLQPDSSRQHSQPQFQSASSQPPPVSVQQYAAPPRQQLISAASDSYPHASSPVNYAENSPASTPLPVFNSSLAPVPQFGPLFPKRAGGGGGGGFSPQKVNASSVYAESLHSAMGRDKFDELLREKLKLEGQLEVLQDEAQSTLQERAELQAQVASLHLKVKTGQQKGEDPEKASLRAELERLRVTRIDHEREALEVQQMLEEKLEELKAVTEELYQSQDTSDKLQVRMKELRDDLQAREVTVQALKSKIAELYVEVQTTLQNKMEADSEARTARNDLVSLVKAKEWYQEQLSTAHQVRAKLQQQLTQIQAQTVSQGSIVERLKLESGRLRQQLRESQERALRDKEQLARHLEAIQQDMMEREAAFQEIQRERVMIEDTFNTQVTTVEEEKTRISNLLQLTSDLEAQLELAYSNSKKKQEHIFSLENQQMDLMKRTTLAQEVLLEKEHLLEEANQKLIEVESQLDAFSKTLAIKDAELLKLREEKASTEIALKAALQEKESVDKALDMLKGDMGKVEKSFKQMRQELGTRLTELETAQTQQKAARDELDRVAHELDIKNRSVETLTINSQEQTAALQQLQAEKADLEHHVAALKQQVAQLQSARPVDDATTQALQAKLHESRARLAEAESRLQVSTAQLQQASAPSQQDSSTVSDEQLQAALAEKDSLKQQLERVCEEKAQSDTEHQQETVKLTEEVGSLRSKLGEERSEFESSVQAYVDQIRSVAEEKQRVETELEMTRRKFELSSVQQKEEINSELQNLMKELETAKLEKQDLENQLYALQAEKDAEVSGLRQQLAETQQSLQDAQEQHNQQQESAAFNQQLGLELERERGRIAGLQQSNATLKEHMKQLEEALAGRESSLIQLNTHLESSNREREKEQQEYLKRIQELEVALKKAKDSGRELRKQIGSKITENKRLLKQQEAHKKEQAELQEEVERHQKDTLRLQSDLEAARQAVRDHQEELQAVQAEKHTLEVELERVKRELVDNADRNPVLLEQIQNLEWQVSQRNQEVQAVQDQLALAEQRQADEIDSLRRVLQDKQEEVESLQGELTASRQEKADQKSRVSELRSVLKASVQHHKLTKKLNSRKKEKGGGGGDADNREEKGTQADMGNGVIIPPLPFDMDVVEQLLIDTAVRPLDSKPLENLSTCLSSLRAEISGLQKQMEVHTTTIHTSTQSWRSVESEVKDLQEVVRSIANTIMDATHTNANATTTSATDMETVDDSGIVDL